MVEKIGDFFYHSSYIVLKSILWAIYIITKSLVFNGQTEAYLMEINEAVDVIYYCTDYSIISKIFAEQLNSIYTI